MLEHKYTDASLGLQGLKGADLAKVQALQHFAETRDMVVYLASMEKEITGAADEPYGGYGRRRRGYQAYGYDDDESDEDDGGHHEITDEIDSSLTLKRVVDIHGHEVVTDVDVSEDEILQEDPFDDREPTDESYEGYTGNAGATATHWYRDAVLVVLPRRDAMKFLLRSMDSYSSYGARKDIMPLLTRYFCKWQEDNDAPHAAADVTTICMHVVNKNSSNIKYGRYSAEVVGQVVSALALVRSTASIGALEKAIKCLAPEEKLPPTAFVALSTLVDYAISPFVRLRPALEAALLKYSTLNGRMSVLKALFGDGFEKATNPEKTSFLQAMILQVLRISVEDGAAIAEAAVLDVTAGILRPVFEARVLPAVIRMSSRTVFALGFLAVWGTKAESAFDDAFVSSVYMQVWQQMLKTFHIERPRLNQPTYPSAHHVVASREEQTLAQASAQDRATVTDHALNNEAALNPIELVKAITRDAEAVDAGLLLGIHLPFLRLLLAAVLDIRSEPLRSPLDTMYHRILTVSLLSYVKEQPADGGGLSRRGLGCQCRRCWDVNLFLASSTQQVGRFPMSKNERHHVHSALNIGGFDGTHETERTYREPQTLVVTKRNCQAEVHDAWLKRCRTAYDELKKFDADALRQVIPAAYGNIMSMECVVDNYASAPEFLRAERGESIKAGRQQASSSQAPVRAGVKRKAAVVDLTGDSD